MGLWTRIGRELKFITALNRVLKRIKPVDPNSTTLVPDDWEKAVDQWGDHVAVIFEDRQVTYRELDAMANRYGHWIKGRGLRRGDVAALVMPNRIEYLAIWLGFAKVGVATALINNNLTGPGLAHSLAISGASQIVADFSTYEAVEQIRTQLPKSGMLWVLGLRGDDETSDRRGLDAAVKGASTVRPDKASRYGMQAKETALLIYTSGTTGLPKAARITHTRAQLYMLAFAAATKGTDKDRVYIVLPLYHSTGGLCAVGAALMNGGAIVLRTKFSATHFWNDVVERQCTMFVYIGELCRYLVNTPQNELETKHKLRLAFGNGLRPEVWKVFQQRFRIPEILEFYGSTEGNVSLFNFDGRPGAVGRIPPYLRNNFNVKLAKIDSDTNEELRGPNGLCIECKPGEIGEALGEIKKNDARGDYTGYADKAASEKKVLHDAFSKGDAWFRTGDLMRQDGDGYLYFVDRIGDTYRWKGENVSTTEIADALSGAPKVKEVTVYGVPVPGMEGKAGMAAVVADDDFNIADFAAFSDHTVADFARPVFVRLQKDITTTGTFKYTKTNLVADGFDPKNTKDPMWYRDPDKGYLKITPKSFQKLDSGTMRL